MAYVNSETMTEIVYTIFSRVYDSYSKRDYAEKNYEVSDALRHTSCALGLAVGQRGEIVKLANRAAEKTTAWILEWNRQTRSATYGSTEVLPDYDDISALRTISHIFGTDWQAQENVYNGVNDRALCAVTQELHEMVKEIYESK